MTEWVGARLAELIRLGRSGEGWGVIGTAVGYSSGTCRGVWSYHGTEDDHAERGRATAAIKSEQMLAASHSEARARERQDIFSGTCFHDSPRALLNFGSVWMPPRPLNSERSITGCSAAWMAS